MKVIFGFDAQFCGHFENIVELPDNITDIEIKAMFPEVMGLEYDDNCYFVKESDSDKSDF